MITSAPEAAIEGQSNALFCLAVSAVFVRIDIPGHMQIV
jgi:hypothetical protein